MLQRCRARKKAEHGFAAGADFSSGIDFVAAAMIRSSERSEAQPLSARGGLGCRVQIKRIRANPPASAKQASAAPAIRDGE